MAECQPLAVEIDVQVRTPPYPQWGGLHCACRLWGLPNTLSDLRVVWWRTDVNTSSTPVATAHQWKMELRDYGKHLHTEYQRCPQNIQGNQAPCYSLCFTLTTILGTKRGCPEELPHNVLLRECCFRGVNSVADAGCFGSVERLQTESRSQMIMGNIGLRSWQWKWKAQDNKVKCEK